MTRLSANSAIHTGRAAIATTSGSRSAGTIRANSSRDSREASSRAIAPRMAARAGQLKACVLGLVLLTAGLIVLSRLNESSPTACWWRASSRWAPAWGWP
jgi:hypothetical protein